MYINKVNRMKLSDFIVNTLKCHGVNTIFGYQGSSISHLIDSINASGIQYIQNYHEQASAFAACGYSEVTNQLGVAISCSGPGATNLITGIANAYYDSLPCLFISGQVSTHEQKQNFARQNGFQETKIVEIVRPITKYAVEIQDPNSIKYELEKAVSIALSGRRGPVFISLPHNIQSSDINADELKGYDRKDESIAIPDFSSVTELLKAAERPVLLIGGGAYELRDLESFKRFVDYFKIPFVSSLKGMLILDQNELYKGFLGVYGTRLANLAVYLSDLVIVLGSRLDGRQTGGKKSEFAPNAKIVHVDCDINEVNRDIHADYQYICKCSDFFNGLHNSDFDGKDFSSWLTTLKDIEDSYQDQYSLQNANPYRAIQHICSLFDNASLVISTDVGQNQMWVAQSLNRIKSSYFITSGGHGTMGYSLPASIGGYYAHAKMYNHIAFMGDGGFQMNIQELETISREKLPIMIVVFVNNSLGLIRDYQSKALGNRLCGSVNGFSVPDLSKIASAYGMKYIRIVDNDFSQLTYEKVANQTVLVQIDVAQNSVIIPELAYKHPIYDMFPFVDLQIIKNKCNRND